MSSRSRALIAALLTMLGAPVRGAEFVRAWTWDLSDPDFGGFSGLEVSEDGTDFVAISDRAAIVEGQLLRHDGFISGVYADPIVMLTDRQGGRMTDKRGDSEGLAISPAGEIFVSFEGRPRVWSYPEIGERPNGLPHPREFNGLGENSALEALAIGPDGALYTLPEEWGRRDQPYPVWRLEDGRWSLPFTIPRRGPYRPVGADFDDMGRLYVLERHFAGLGFSIRVRRFTLAPHGYDQEERLLETGVGEHDNLEGLAVWRDADGVLRLTMISDDNFRFFQRTEFVEYKVPG